METIGEAFSEMNGPMTTIGVGYALFHKIPRIGGGPKPERNRPICYTDGNKNTWGYCDCDEISDTRHFGFDLVFKTRNSAAKKWS